MPRNVSDLNHLHLNYPDHTISMCNASKVVAEAAQFSLNARVIRLYAYKFVYTPIGNLASPPDIGKWIRAGGSQEPRSARTRRGSSPKSRLVAGGGRR